MYFRNLSLFRFSTTAAKQIDGDLETRLAAHRARPCGPFEMATRGWVSPFGGEQALHHGVGNYTLLTLGGEDKLLPAACVNAVLNEKLAAIAAERGKPPGGRERRRLKEEVLNELMPRALARPHRLAGYLDLDRGWAVIDTASKKPAEALLTELRNTLETFPVFPLDPEESPQALYTSWLSGGELPEGWVLGDECEMRDPQPKGAIVRLSRSDLSGSELQEHLKSGKQVTRLGLVVEDRLSFTLDENLVVRKLRFLEQATEELEATERDSAAAEFAARFALMCLSLTPILAQLEKTFRLSRPKARA